MQTAELLIEYEPYNDLVSGKAGSTRVSPGAMTWLIQAVNGKTYNIKFEKNFSKKHLYTSSKKQHKVKKEVIDLWKALPSGKKRAYLYQGWWLNYPTELWEEAQRKVDEAKFQKQVNHRSVSEQECNACYHKRKKHFQDNGTYNPNGCNHGGVGVCGCTAFISPYGMARNAKGKNTQNPLAGPKNVATTATNTVIIMNRLSKSLLETTIVNAIIAKEDARALAGEAWGAGQVGINLNCEKLTFNFGVQNKGCVLEITAGGDFSSWVEMQAAVVSVKKDVVASTANPNSPVYAITHMFGADSF